MGAHALPDVVVVPLGEEVAIHLAHPLIAEGPGVVGHVLDTAAQHMHLIAGARVVGQFGLKDPGVMGGGHRRGRAPGHQLNPLGLGQPHANHPAAALEGLGPQHRKGVIVPALGQALGIVHHPVELSQHRLDYQSVAGSLRPFFSGAAPPPSSALIR